MSNFEFVGFSDGGLDKWFVANATPHRTGLGRTGKEIGGIVMERLTDRHEGSAYFPMCFEEPCGGNGCRKAACGLIDQVCFKLAAYEGTGLTPEEVFRLC